MSAYRNTQESDVLEVALRQLDAKRLARCAGVSTRTAENWQQGRCEPRASALIRIMIGSREVAQTILTATLEGWQDAEEARLTAELQALRARRRNGAAFGAVGRAIDRTADVVAATALSASAALKNRGAR